jgi:transposase
MEINMKRSVIGIDIGKYELVAYCDGRYEKFSNNHMALAKWFASKSKWLRTVDLVAFEATGGYERLLKKLLIDNQIPFRQIHANHIRAFANASGISAKTDEIDARVITEYANKLDIQAKPVISRNEALKTLITRRKQLLEMRLQEKNRLDTCDKLATKWINKNIVNLSKQIDQVETAIDEEIEKDGESKRLYELYSSIPGIGKVISLQLITDLPELLTENDKTLAALVGLAPWNHDSGRISGRRRTRGGRTQIRGLLYMAALVAARCNPELRIFYQKLKNKGKATKVALIAIAHKLLIVLRSVAQRGTAWVPSM